MFRLASNSTALAGTSAVINTQQRLITRLHTSYHQGYLRLDTLTGPRATLPKGAAVTGALRSRYYKKAAQEPARPAEAAVDLEGDVEDADVMNKAKAPAPPPAAAEAPRPYVPLSDASRIELQGDYLMEGGQPFDALKYYAVVAKAYAAAYSANDNQRASIAIKLTRAFRCCNMYDSAVANGEHALFMLDNNTAPHLDLVCEALVELADAKAARGDKDAGLVYEDVMNIIDSYHSLGNTERTIRMMPRLGVRMGVDHDKKFFYLTPFDTDRVFHLGDHAMGRAEEHYRATGDQEGVVRVLERRAQLINTKQFEMRNAAGRMRTLRGYSSLQNRNHGFSSTPRELLMYSPTIHQVYLDRSVSTRTPVGREEEAMPGANRRIMDDGNYSRILRRRNGARSAPSTGDRSVNSMNSIYDY